MPWSYGSWIYNYLFNQCLSSLTLWARIPPRRGVLNTTLYDKGCQWLAAGQWFSLGTLVSSTNKTDRHDIAEIFLKVALNTIIITLTHINWLKYIWNKLNSMGIRRRSREQKKGNNKFEFKANSVALHFNEYDCALYIVPYFYTHLLYI